MVPAPEEPVPSVDQRTSGVYARPAPPSPVTALRELRQLTGGEPVAVLFFASPGRAPEGAAYPPQPRRVEAGYSLTHRLTSWLHGFTRSALTPVPAYLSPWFSSPSVIVVPIGTPQGDVGAFVLSPACAAHATDIRALAADLALRVEMDARRGRLDVLRGEEKAG